MDPGENPFAPGAGTQPPELAGRSGIIADAEVALARAHRGLGKSSLLLGLRGVGKTVLLNRIREIADTKSALSITFEAPEREGLAEVLVPPLRSALYKLSTSEKAKRTALEAMGGLRAFASAFKLKVGEVEFGVKPATGTADSGSLEHDLPELLALVSKAAREDKKSLALFVDEVQYLGGKDLSALIVAVHRLGQQALPFLLFGAGLPQLTALTGEAKSYAERLFTFPKVGALTDEAAAEAIRAPLSRNRVSIRPDALRAIVEVTRGYPYFLQEWGFETWNVSPGTPIKLSDVTLATKGAVARLDTDFFAVRFDRLTPKEKEYMRAMATLGAGPHRSGEIAAAVGKTVKAVAPVRDSLIKKGMLYSPQHGDTAYTVPMFDEFLERAMPSPNKVTKQPK